MSIPARRRRRRIFVDIVTTIPTHRGLVLLAAEYKTPVIVQKPFAPTWEDCVAMVAACEKAGVPLMVHENFRFQAPMIEAKRLLSEGAIGEITWGRVNCAPPTRVRPRIER